MLILKYFNDQFKSTLPKGIRNNNPLNIEKGGDWHGLKIDQTDNRFAQFVSPVYGIRAGAKIISNYEKFYGINTIRGIIERWAPPFVNGENENPTENYILYVSNVVGIEPDETLNIRESLVPIIKAMTQFENGIQPYSEKVYAQGVELAFV